MAGGRLVGLKDIIFVTSLIYDDDAAEVLNAIKQVKRDGNCLRIGS